MSENKYPNYAPDTDARSQAPTFDEMVAMIEKLFKDYLKDIRKNVLTDEQIEERWQRYKTLNHLYQDEQPKPAGAAQPDETQIPTVDHDQAHINMDAGMPDFEAYYQAGFSNGHDIGYDKAKQEVRPAGAVLEPEFIEFMKNERSAISNEMLSDEWWLTIPPSKRVVIENILIAYDQMARKLNGSKPAAYER